MVINVRTLNITNSKKIDIVIKNIIPNEIEQFIINKINKKPPLSYGQITDVELEIIKNKVFDTFKIKISKYIIVSIKSGYMKNFIIKNFSNLKKNSKSILNEYKTDGILQISEKYNISPMTILRYVFNSIYHKKLKELINSNILSSRDKAQLILSEKNDIYVSLDQEDQSKYSIDFEKKIEDFLIKNKVDYKTQKQLTQEQIIKYGKAINTPDFLITSELIINSKKINWIDAKNFYGSNIDFIITKTKKQIKKYINSHGPGCLIFNHGFNSKLNYNNVLILDYDSLLTTIK